MSDNNKYYTPAIEEFHVGFECEHLYKNHPTIEDGWHLLEIERDTRLICWQDYINQERVRVKYLDMKDIDKFWDKTTERDSMLYGIKKTDSVKSMSVCIDYDPKSNLCRIHCLEGVLFLGIIKNKSKLEEIMKLTRVINEFQQS